MNVSHPASTTSPATQDEGVRTTDTDPLAMPIAKTLSRNYHKQLIQIEIDRFINQMHNFLLQLFNKIIYKKYISSPSFRLPPTAKYT